MRRPRGWSSMRAPRRTSSWIARIVAAAGMGDACVAPTKRSERRPSRVRGQHAFVERLDALRLQRQPEAALRLPRRRVRHPRALRWILREADERRGELVGVVVDEEPRDALLHEV